MKYLYDNLGNPVTLARGWLKLPNGDVVSNPPLGWVHEPTGYTVAEYVPPPPPPLTPEEELAQFRENAVADKMQVMITLDAWGILDTVMQTVANAPRAVQIGFEHSNRWRRKSPTINAMFSNLTLPDGTPVTDEVVDEFFKQAMTVEL